MSIPKIIHYCWFGPKSLSALNERCITSWQALLPDYEVRRWDESNVSLDNDYCRAAYAQGQWSRVSNYVRVQVLHAHGGWYFDTDIEVLKRFDDLDDNEVVLGFQQERDDVDWINNAVIGAVAGHPFLARSLLTLDATYTRHQYFPRGPELFTQLLRGAGLSAYGRQQVHGITLLPYPYFYPYPWNGKFTPECITPETYCIHHWEGTWT